MTVTVATISSQGPAGPPSMTTTSASFTMPAISASGTMTVVNATWIVAGMQVFATGIGYLLVSAAAVGPSTTITVTNQGATGNVVGGTVVPSGAQVVPSGVTGPVGVVPGEVSTGWINLLADGSTSIFATGSLTANLAAYEYCLLSIAIDIEKLSAYAVGGSWTKFAQVQNVGGVITDVLTGGTGPDFSRDASRPAPPTNLPTALQGATATLTATGAVLSLNVARPTGVPVRVRAVVSISRQTRPAAALLISATPNVGVVNGGLAVALTGENLSNATSATLAGVAATVNSSSDLAVSITSGNQPGQPGTGDIVVVTPQGTATITGGWTYTAGIIPTISALSHNTSPGDGGVSVVITGTGFTGATNVAICGVNHAAGAGAGQFVVNSGTQITVSSVASLSGHQGLGDVIITSSTSNLSVASAASKFFALPTAIFSWRRADYITKSGSNLATWPDLGSGNLALSATGTLVVTASDVGGQQSVAEQLGVGYNTFGVGSAFISSTTLSVLIVALRPTSAASARFFAVYDYNQATGDDGNVMGFAVTEGAGSTIKIARNGVSQTGGTTPGTSTPFVLSARFDGTNGIARLNGVDVATIASSGTFAPWQCAVGTGWGPGGGSYFNPMGAMHEAELILSSRAFTAADYVTLSAYTNWRYGIAAA